MLWVRGTSEPEPAWLQHTVELHLLRSNSSESSGFSLMLLQVLRYSDGEKYGPHYDSVQGEALKVETFKRPAWQAMNVV